MICANNAYIFQLYRLMNNVRDEVKDYQENYASAFSAYFDVTREACIELYQLLMRDVQLLCTITQQKQVKIRGLGKGGLLTVFQTVHCRCILNRCSYSFSVQ